MDEEQARLEYEMRREEERREEERQYEEEMYEQALMGAENERLRTIARQMFSCLSLRDLYHAGVPLDGDVADVYNAWQKEFGTPANAPTPPPPSS